MRARMPVVGLVAGAMALAACAAPTETPTRGGDDPALASFSDQRLDWAPCEADASLECATLTVPLDYAAPDGETVAMAVYRNPATRAAQGTVLVMPGGPGTGGDEMLGSGSPFRELGWDHDLVSYDARAVGSTMPFRCEDEAAFQARRSLDATPTTPAEEEALVAALERYAAACVEAAGAALPLVGTRETVADLDLLRSALGEEHLTAFGSSYGALVGLEYLRAFPDRVGRLVLDAPRSGGDLVDPSRFALVVAESEARFDDAMDACFANPFLPCPLGDTPRAARATAEALLLGLDADPVDLGDDGLLTRERAVGIVWDLMSVGQDGWLGVVRGLGRAMDGDWSELVSLERDPKRSTTPDAGQAIWCADVNPLVPTREEIRALAAQQADEHPVFGETAAWWLLGCPGWPATEGLATTTDAVANDADVLVVTSADDPLTPSVFAEDVVERIGATLLTYTGPEHVAYAWSDCVRYAVNDFLTDGDLPLAETCGTFPLR